MYDVILRARDARVSFWYTEINTHHSFPCSYNKRYCCFAINHNCVFHLIDVEYRYKARLVTVFQFSITCVDNQFNELYN